MEDSRDLDPAPPAHRPATAAAAPPETGLGGPGTASDPARRDTESPSARAAAPGHPGHGPALAPRHRSPAARSIRGKTGRPDTRRKLDAARSSKTIATARSRSSAGCCFRDVMTPNFPRGHTLQETRGGPVGLVPTSNRTRRAASTFQVLRCSSSVGHTSCGEGVPLRADLDGGGRRRR